jgi:hypothetical protein
MPKHRAAHVLALLLALALAGCRAAPAARGTGLTPTPPPSVACPSISPEARDQPRAENIALAGQIGGRITALAAQGSFVYATAGPRLLAIDAGNPAQPVLTSQSPVFDSVAGAVSIDGPYAYVLIANAGVCVFDLANPAQPQPIAALPTQGRVQRMLAQDGRLYYSEYGFSDRDSPRSILHILDVSNPTRPVELGTYALPGEHQLRGLAVSGTRLYLLDRNGTLSILDAADPARPVRLGELAVQGYRPDSMPPALGGFILGGDTAYILLDGGTLGIIDVSDPARPAEASRLALKGTAHELAVAGHWLYVTYSYYDDRSTTRDELVRLYVVDVADPRHPLPAGSADTGGAWGALALTPHAAYVAGWGSSDGLRVLDLSDPATPRLAGQWAWPGVPEYTAAARGYAYVTTTEGLFALDARDLGDIRVTSYFTGVRGIPAIAGNTLYVGSDRSLQTFDLADPARPVALASVESYRSSHAGRALQVLFSGRYAYVGHQIFDVSDPADPRRIGTLPASRLVTVSQGYAYLSREGEPETRDRGIEVLDLSEPTQPRPLSSYALEDRAGGLAAAGAYLYASVHPNTLQVFDMRDPADPVARGRLRIVDQWGAFGWTLLADRCCLYVAYEGLAIADVRDPDHPVIVGAYLHPNMASHTSTVAVDGALVYLASGSAGLYILRFDASGATPLTTVTPTPTRTAPARTPVPITETP